MSLSAPLFKEKWTALFLQAVLSDIDAPLFILITVHEGCSSGMGAKTT